MNVHHEVFTVLTLDESERLWLRGVMQNLLFDETPEKEDSLDKRMREEFFKATDTVKQLF